MNRSKILGGIAAATLVMIAGAASAQAGPDGVGQPRAGRGEAMPLRADADGDGRLSKAEFVEARIAPLVAMDTDKDGTVTVAEREASRQARAVAVMARRFERLDADKDGVVSRAEFDAAAQKTPPARARSRARGARHVAAHRAGHGHRGRQLAGVGRDHAAAPVVIAEVRARAELAFDRLDADKDGFLIRTEMQAARASMRAGAGHGAMSPEDRARSLSVREARREARRLSREVSTPQSAPASSAAPASE